jgi:KDO2-lipid IV(A) lauroyltransferase
VRQSVGYFFYVFDGAHRRVAADNVATAFPRRSRAERRAIVRAVFAHFGRLLFEFLKFSTLSPEKILSRVEFDGEERVRLAYGQGKGVLFITGHFGFWEIHAIAHPLRFEPIGVLARTLDNARLNTLLEEIRQCTGNVVIYRQGSIRKVMGTLADKHGVAILIDQHISGADAVNVEFFERTAATTSAVAAMALHRRAVVPVFALPLGARPLPADLRASSGACGGETARRRPRVHAAARTCWRCRPAASDLWLWMHRR